MGFLEMLHNSLSQKSNYSPEGETLRSVCKKVI